jgi:rubrerythrin
MKNIEEEQVFAKPKKVAWQCANCGHTYQDTNAVETCPVCNHPQAYFQVLAKNY